VFSLYSTKSALEVARRGTQPAGLVQRTEVATGGWPWRAAARPTRSGSKAPWRPRARPGHGEVVLEPPRPEPEEFGKGQGPPAACRRLGKVGSPRAGGPPAKCRRWGRCWTATQEADSPPLYARVAMGARAATTAVRVVERQGRGAVVLVLVPVEDDGWEVWRQGDGRRGGGGDGGLSAAAKGASRSRSGVGTGERRGPGEDTKR
jgi:hypothetical protein